MTVYPDAKPIRDVNELSCAPIMGFAGSLVGEGDYTKWFFVDDRGNTAKIFSGAFPELKGRSHRMARAL